MIGRVGRQWRALALRERVSCTEVRTIGIPQRFLQHASRAQLLEEVGWTAQHIGNRVIGWMSAASGARSAVGRGPSALLNRAWRSAVASSSNITVFRITACSCRWLR